MGKNLTALAGIFSSLDQIIAWENGELDQTETVELFQALINNGMAWELQGHYGRTAKRFIDAGLCHEVGDEPGRVQNPVSEEIFQAVEGNPFDHETDAGVLSVGAVLEDKKTRGKSAKYRRDQYARAAARQEHASARDGSGPRRLDVIAREIRQDWKKVYFGAVPYLDALAQLGDISDAYGEDTGESVVAYFLSNATTWRGAVARRVKAELNVLLKAS